MGESGIKKSYKKIKFSHVLILSAVIIILAAVAAVLLYFLPDYTDEDSFLGRTLKDVSNLIITETETETEITETETETDEFEETETEETETEEPETEKIMVVPNPGIDEQLLTVNEWSRPGEATDTITNVVIHYLANPGTTAQQNHDYFESLKNNAEWVAEGLITEDEIVYMSANFVIGIDGEIIECVPPGEIAYASNSANSYSVSIENCHIDSTGEFTEATYRSLVKLTAYIVDMYDLDRDSIIRHYDVTGKDCPLYYVENEDKWETFKDDVMDYIEGCRNAVG